MRRQPILRDLDPIGEAGGHHPPADRALQRAESEDRSTAARRSPAAIQPRHRNQRNGSRNAAPISRAEQPVRPFPPEDGLELGEASCRG